MHIAYVALLWGPPLNFSYLIPSDLISKVQKGSFVKIPLGKTIRIGIVINIITKQISELKLKVILDVYPIPSYYSSFINYLTEYYQLENNILYKSLSTWLKKGNSTHSLNIESSINNISLEYSLNDEQKEAVSFIQSKTTAKPFLLHGVTGSGKTNVYVELIKKNILEDKQSSIILAPEITLAYNLFKKIKSLIHSHIPIFLCTSKTPESEKKTIIEYILQNIPIICVGVHIPLFLPFQSVGFIIIDEEHDGSYIMPTIPFLNTKHIALIRSKYDNAKIILGSATPSIQSLYNAEIKKYEYVKLTHRYFGTPLIKPTCVQLTPKNHIPESVWISNILYEAIQKTLKNNKQVIIYINRRGMYNYAQCSTCKLIYWCPKCSIPFTVHHHDLLECHKCGTHNVLSPICVGCSKKTIIKKGVGTQQLVQLLSTLFPFKKIERLDYEIAVSKKAVEGILEDMQNHKIDILVGTQLLSKGLHFKNVDLVGIISADASLSLPNYKNYEEIIQKIIQVSGRTGRESEGQVILQTLKEYINESFFSETFYEEFYKLELEKRKKYEYPPFVHLSELTIFDKNETTAYQLAENIYHQLNIHNINKDLFISKPIKSFTYKLKNIYYWNIILKCSHSKEIFNLIQKINIVKLKYIYFIPTL